MIKLTPPMGWNSWNTFGENINEKMIFETADVMAESGLRDKGYEYLVIDDCWSLRERDENGRLVPDPEKFPHGMKAVADYVHSKGLSRPVTGSSRSSSFFVAQSARARSTRCCWPPERSR